MSNRLPVLMAEIKSASVVFEQAQKMTADTIIVMGQRLIEAKDLCGHGEWLDFLKGARVSTRSAQRYMRIVKAGMCSDYLSIVGLTDALEEIDAALAMMPPLGSATLATWEADEAPDVMIWWPVSKYRAGFVQAYQHRNKPGCGATITEDMPTYLVAFLIECFAGGLMQDGPRPQLSNRTITAAERDDKIRLIRTEVAL